MRGEKYSRQSFLGGNSQAEIARTVIGIVGLGGGGSQIVQQLAHIGFERYVIYDPDIVEDTNLNRLVGATEADVEARRAKVSVAERVIRGLKPDARVESLQARWQEAPAPLRGCNVIFGCVDTFAERRELEVLSRRYLIPYIDIGMDVHQIEGQAPAMGGQVILSLPGHPCMFCMGFLTEARLAQEAALYGAVGGRPQVVWPNGVLASTAVGIAVDLITNWTRALDGPVFLSYNGNTGTVQPHPRLRFLQGACSHYSPQDVGDPVFVEL